MRGNHKVNRQAVDRGGTDNPLDMQAGDPPFVRHFDHPLPGPFFMALVAVKTGHFNITNTGYIYSSIDVVLNASKRMLPHRLNALAAFITRLFYKVADCDGLKARILARHQQGGYFRRIGYVWVEPF